MRLPPTLLADPFDAPVWIGIGEPVRREEVQAAIDEGRLVSEPVGPGDWNQEVSRQQHVERIAYFVVHGWKDPINIEPYPGEWPVQDGNHRLAAAVFRGDTDIEVAFWGDLGIIRDLYGNEVAQQVEKEWDAREPC